MTEPAPTRRRAPRFVRWAIRIGLLLLSLALTVFLADKLVYALDLFGVRYPEQVARYRNEALVQTVVRENGELDLEGTLFVHEPNLDLDLGPFTLRTNARGFRGPEVAVEKPEGTTRILFLGDSVTFGYGVDDEVTFVRRFERALRSRAEPGTDYEVLNTGIPSYDSRQELAMLRRHGFAMDPDVVALVFVVNDIEPTSFDTEVAQGLVEASPPPPAPPPTWIDGLVTQLSRVTPSLAAVVHRYSISYQDWDAILEAHGGEYVPETFDAKRRIGWQRSQDAMRAMRDECKARDVRFVVLDQCFPPIRSLPSFCEAESIPYFDLNLTEAERDLPVYNSAMDPHWNARGHEIVLENLERAWTALGLPGARRESR